MNRKCGFTRTETVLVSGVAALLGAALWPAMVRAQNADETPSSLQTCQSNLKQIGLGILQYVQDYDEKYPMATYANGRESWRSAIQPYVKSVSIFGCPSNPNHFLKTQSDNLHFPDTTRVLRPDAVGKTRSETATLTNGETQTFPITEYADDQYIEVPQLTFIPISYAGNANIMWRGGSINLADMTSPSTLILVGESTRGDATMPFSRPTGEFRRGRALFAGHRGEANIAQFHNEAAQEEMQDDESAAPQDAAPEALTNCLFSDGHVKAMRPTETLEMWSQLPLDRRSTSDLMRRLSAAEEFYANQLYVNADNAETGATEEQPDKTDRTNKN